LFRTGPITQPRGLVHGPLSWDFLFSTPDFIGFEQRAPNGSLSQAERDARAERRHRARGAGCGHLASAISGQTPPTGP
jgi:hypothetical protein